MNKANTRPENGVMALVRMLRGGQVTLPAEARKALKLKEGDYLDLEVTERGVLLKPVAVVDRAKAWDDLAAVLVRPKNLGRYRYSIDEVGQFCRALLAVAEIVGELPKIDAVPNDPKDNPIVATAVVGKADYLVTGDRAHLLPIKEHAGVRI